MVSRAFVKNVEDACDEALCVLGAKRPRRGDCYFEIDNEALCWIGLNQGRHDEFLRINPNVGLHFVSIMQIFAQFRGNRYKKGSIATHAIHLGELCPDMEQFIFTQKSDIDSEATRLAKAIFEFGLPYAKRYSSIESILPKLKERMPMFGGYPERYLVGLYLLGRIGETEEFIKDRILMYQREEDEATQEQFKEFSDLLLERIQTDRNS